MAKLDLDNDSIYQLVNSMKEMSGSNIYYKNIEGVILWHNNNVLHDLKLNKENVIGETEYDLFSPESAKFCLEDDLEVINTANVVSKQRSLQLINGEIQEYFIIKTPWRVSSGRIGGIIVNSINMRHTICKKLATCYIQNQKNQYLDTQLQKLYFKIKEPLKEILLLANLMVSREIDDDSILLCLELRGFAKRLLSDCEYVLMSNKNVNVKQDHA